MKTVSHHFGAVFFLACILAPQVGWAGTPQDNGREPDSRQTSVPPESEADSEPPEASPNSEIPEEIEVMESSSRRNENVPVYQIDTNVIKELNQRLGVSYEIVPEATADKSFFAAEFGRSPRGDVIINKLSSQSSWHGELFELHQNSSMNARTFFQFGPVQPARENRYGARLGGPLGSFADVMGGFSQEKIRGMVNGNVPLAGERTPLTTDPQLRPIVERFLAAFPNELPNRTDIDERALNTNAPQRIDSTSADLRLDKELGDRNQLTLFHEMGRTRIDAFQLVAGQNPDTEIHTHHSRVALYREMSVNQFIELGFTFQRTKSVLKSPPEAVGPRVRFARQIAELGPSGQFPVNRAANTFSWGGVMTQLMGSGDHTLTWGGTLIRTQLNGIESNDLRGRFNFSNTSATSNTPARTAIENFLYGVPARYDVTLGDVHRGYRNWHGDLFFGHRWRVTPQLQLYYGLRYGLETTPIEVNALDILPYGCDCNNVSPRLSLAYDFGKGWVTRASYNLGYGPIRPVTYQQIRNNLPLVQRFVLQDPDLANPLKDIDPNNPGARVSPVRISPDLVSPYSHQYNLTLEKRLSRRYLMRLGYLGSRTLKLHHPFITNRADLVPGIPTTRATVDERRPDQRFSDILTIVNGGIGYLDAFQVNFEAPYRNGLSWKAVYTFSKALDTGSDYAATAATRDLIFGRGQNQHQILEDLKGPSNFHSPHAFLLNYSYDFPRPVSAAHWSRLLLNGWQVSGTALLKMGTPFNMFVGSDSPGFGNVDGGTSDRPSILDPSILGMSISHPDTAPDILRKDRFDFIQPGESRGNIGRNAFRKAPIRNFNLALSKEWQGDGLDEWTLLLRAEAYNLTNTPQFDEPNRNLTAEAFGTITNALNDGRVFQLGLQLIF